MSCPECRYPKYQCTDTQPVMGGEAKRIRRQCANCGHSATIYEVSRSVLDELKELRLLRDRIRSLVGGPKATPATASIDCGQCRLWGPGGCDLDLPEAGGDFAAECSTFNPKP